MHLFAELNAQHITIVFITHESDVAQKAKIIIRVQDGLIIS